MSAMKGSIFDKAQTMAEAYERYASVMEREHPGEWVALSPGEDPIFRGTEDEVREAAIQRFGKGNFALWRVGHVGKWRNSHP